MIYLPYIFYQIATDNPVGQGTRSSAIMVLIMVSRNDTV